MTNFLNAPAVPITIRPKRNLGGITATVVIEEIASDDLAITEHPIQQGADITDHAYKKNASVQIRAMWDDSVKPLNEIYDDLLKLQASRIPFDVITGKRSYKNMLFQSLGQSTDSATEKCLSITAQLYEANIVSVEVTAVPPRARQRNAAKTGATENAGTKTAQNANDSKRRSALKVLVGG